MDPLEVEGAGLQAPDCRQLDEVRPGEQVLRPGPHGSAEGPVRQHGL